MAGNIDDYNNWNDLLVVGKEQDLPSGMTYDVTAIVGAGNVYGTQFHPEKSGEAGLRLLKNFVSLA